MKIKSHVGCVQGMERAGSHAVGCVHGEGVEGAGSHAVGCVQGAGVEGAGAAQQGAPLEREQPGLPAGLRGPRHPGVSQELPDRVPRQAGQLTNVLYIHEGSVTRFVGFFSRIEPFGPKKNL